MSPRDNAAARLFGTLFSLWPCEECEGWPSGYNLRLFVGRTDEGLLWYVAVFEEAEAGEGEPPVSNKSFHLTDFTAAIDEMGFSIQAIHYGDPGLFTVKMLHQELSMLVTFHAIVDDRCDVPQHLLQKTTQLDLENVRFDDLEVEQLPNLFKEFRFARAYDPPGAKVDNQELMQAVNALLDSVRMSVTDLSQGTVFPVLTACAGYDYHHDKVAKLTPGDRKDLVTWLFGQLVRIRCKQPTEKPPKPFQMLFKPIRLST